MRKIKRILAVFMSAMVLISSIGMNVLAAESNESTAKSSTIRVYDSKGNLIDELDSMDELNKYFSNSKARMGEIAVAKFLYDVLVGLTVLFVYDGITNIWNYLEEYDITIPTVNPGDEITVYSLDGNIYNPYPPNSYQAVTWKQTNFIVVVS